MGASRQRVRGPAIVVAIAAIAAAAAQVLLQRTFAGVRHPVSLAEANTTSDAEVVRGWYDVLERQGTFDRMVATELVDFLWVAALTTFVVAGTVLAARLVEQRHPGAATVLRRVAPWVALAPALDAVENVISLIMLSDPDGFADGLAVAHAWVSRVKLGAIIGVAIAVPGFALVAAVVNGGADAGGPRGGRDADSLPPRVASTDADRRLP